MGKNVGNTSKTWRDVFLDNYNGTSDIAQEVEPFVKANYKGNSYIPWGTMERLTYMARTLSTICASAFRCSSP